jgi:hypothetical protein
MGRVRVRWSTVAKVVLGAIIALLALQLLPALLKPPEPPPLAADVGLPKVVVEPVVKPVPAAAPKRHVPLRLQREPRRRKRLPAPSPAPVGNPKPAPNPLPPAPAPMPVPAPSPVPAPAPVPEPPPPPDDGSVEFAPR